LRDRALLISVLRLNTFRPLVGRPLTVPHRHPKRQWGNFFRINHLVYSLEVDSGVQLIACIELVALPSNTIVKP